MAQVGAGPPWLAEADKKRRCLRIRTDPRVADIARSGALRLALFPSFFYRSDAASGEPRGVGIEIARALASQSALR